MKKIILTLILLILITGCAQQIQEKTETPPDVSEEIVEETPIIIAFSDERIESVW